MLRSLLLSSDPCLDSGSAPSLAPAVTTFCWHRHAWLSVLTVYIYPRLWVLVPAPSSCQPGHNNLWNSATGDIWHRDHVPRHEKIKALSRADLALAAKAGLAQQTPLCAFSRSGWRLTMRCAVRKGNDQWQRLSTFGGCRRLLVACFQINHL